MTEALAPAPPPDALPDLGDDDLLPLGSGDTWARLFWHAGNHSTRWNAFRMQQLAIPSRFDVFGDGRIDGVAYVAVGAGLRPPDVGQPLTAQDCSALATCVAEAAQPARVLDRLGLRTLAVAQLAGPLRVLDLSSDWATRAGAGTHLSTGTRHRTIAWAASIATRWPDLDGVGYVAATRPAGRAVALWSPRAVAAVRGSALRLHRRLDDPILRPALSWAANLTGTTLLT